jgi:CheY-like chemotaxis protein
MLAHELRNPLAPIRNAAHLLKLWGPAEPRLTRAREIIDRQVRHLARQLDDLLDVSRITRGKIELRPVRLDLVALVRETAEDTRGVIEEAGLTLTLDLPPEPLWVQGDPTRLAQVVGNLLANAVKFTQHGGIVTVRLSPNCGNLAPRPPCLGGKGESCPPDAGDSPFPPREGGRGVRSAGLVVRDTGIGIASDMLPRVFETFTQADRSLDRSQGGLGLGLALVKGLVELHGGQVQAHSEGVGRGAEFTVRLPLAAPPAASEVRELSAPAATGPIRVLIVEDNRDAAETLRDLLELSGCTVAVAYSGPEALEMARGFHPEVVLCDLGLPGMNGYEVAAALRQDPAAATARLIAVTGYGQEEDRRRSHDAGFDIHLTKPIDPDELQRLLEVAPQCREA